MSFGFEVLKTDPIGCAAGAADYGSWRNRDAGLHAGGHGRERKGHDAAGARRIGRRPAALNTYHLYLRPGHELIAQMGGLHRFMSWPGAILTDSGGFQIFSLADLRKVTDEGVRFRSHLDGSEHFLTPEKAVEIQRALGSDIAMVLDECIEYPAERERAASAAERTANWARRCRQAIDAGAPSASTPSQVFFAIVQGGGYADLRRENAAQLVELGFPGYAVGGLAVGEPHELTCEMAAAAASCLPAEKPRYMMGVGRPRRLPTMFAAAST